MNECFNFIGQRITNHEVEVCAKKSERHWQGGFAYDGVKDAHGKLFWYVVLSKPTNVNVHEQAIFFFFFFFCMLTYSNFEFDIL